MEVGTQVDGITSDRKRCQLGLGNRDLGKDSKPKMKPLI